VTIGAPDLNSFYLNPVTVKGGKTSTGVVGVSAPAPAGGLKVVLTSSLKSATVPATVLIPAGKSSVTFSIKTTAVKTAANSTITVSFGGATKTAVLTIN